MIKLYKFRPLENEMGFCRAWHILKTGKFWCSKFSELNDPMEGVFSVIPDRNNSIGWMVNAIYSAKNAYKICSFSGKEGFENPTLWGYYAGGFKGMAIEIEAGETFMRKMRYKKDILNVNVNVINDTNIKNILTAKLIPWKNEAEYRFLIKSEQPNHNIGKITAVYFGNPYGNLLNTDTIQNEKKNLVDYFRRRNCLISHNRKNGINFFTVKIKRHKVVPDRKL